jgi:hypothetical protein
MANKKPKTPPPPRRVQAPQRRVDPKSPSDLIARQRALLYGIAGAGIVGLVVVVLVIALAGGSSAAADDKKVAAAMATAGCTYKTVKAYVPKGQGVHVASLTKKFPWNTTPPSNGQHYPLWAVWGFYTDPINPRQVVHNEEHGGVIYWWGPDVPAATVNRLRQLYQQEATGTFGTPYQNLGSKVAITAWTGNPSKYTKNGYFGQGHIGVCPSYDDNVEKAFVAFRDAYRGKGPEGIPLELDKPGLGPQ